MKRSVEPERALATRRPPEAPERGPEPVAAQLLALQRSAGNRAVAAMLARDTKTPPKGEKAAPLKPTGPYVTIEGLGVIPLESFQWGSHRGPGGHGGGQPQVTEMQFSSRSGPHSNALFRATLSGEGKDAIESWTLNFTGVEFKKPNDGEAKQDDVSTWDLAERYPS